MISRLVELLQGNFHSSLPVNIPRIEAQDRRRFRCCSQATVERSPRAPSQDRPGQPGPFAERSRPRCCPGGGADHPGPRHHHQGRRGVHTKGRAVRYGGACGSRREPAWTAGIGGGGALAGRSVAERGVSLSRAAWSLAWRGRHRRSSCASSSWACWVGCEIRSAAVCLTGVRSTRGPLGRGCGQGGAEACAATAETQTQIAPWPGFAHFWTLFAPLMRHEARRVHLDVGLACSGRLAILPACPPRISRRPALYLTHRFNLSGA